MVLQSKGGKSLTNLRGVYPCTGVSRGGAGCWCHCRAGGRLSRLYWRHRGMEGAFPFQMDGVGGSCCWWPLPFLPTALPAPPPPLNLEPAFLLSTAPHLSDPPASGLLPSVLRSAQPPAWPRVRPVLHLCFKSAAFAFRMLALPVMMIYSSLRITRVFSSGAAPLATIPDLTLMQVRDF